MPKIITKNGFNVRGFNGLRECVAQGFAYLDASSDIISESSLPARRAGEHILTQFIDL